MSGSGRLNDLDSGGSDYVKKGTRLDLQEKMNKRFGQNNRSSVSNSENTSPVPFGEQATGPDGASGRPNVEAAVASGRERRKQGDIDEALNSVLYELDKKEKSKRQHSSKVDATALFQNNLDDPETPTVLNISPVGATEAKLGAFGRNDDKKKDVLRNIKQSGSFKQEENHEDESDNNAVGQSHTNSQDPLQQMLQSLISDYQNGNDTGDALSASFGGRSDGNSLSEDMFGLVADRNHGSERQQTEKNINEDPLKDLVANGRQIPVMGSMGKRSKAMETCNDRLKAQGEKSKNESHETKNDENMYEKRSAKRTEPEDDPNDVMLKDMTKDSSMSNLFPGMGARKGQGGVKGEQRENGNQSSFAAPRSLVRGRSGDRLRNGRCPEAMKSGGNFGINAFATTSGDTDPFPEYTGGRNGNQLTDMLSGLGRGSTEGEGSSNSFRDLIGKLGGGGGNGDLMQQTLGSLIGGLGERGGSGLNEFAAALLGESSGGQSGSDEQMSQTLSSFLGGAEKGGLGNLPSAMMGRGGGQGERDEQMSKVFNSLMGGAGRGSIGGFPFAMMGRDGGQGERGEQIPQFLNCEMGGAGRGGIGNFPTAMMGRGGGQGERGEQMPQAFSSLMGGAGRGGIGGFPSAMMGRGGGRGGSGLQMPQALSSLMDGAGRGSIGDFPSAMMGRGGGRGGSGNQLALRHMMGGGRGNQKASTMPAFEDLDPDKASENDVIHQLLGYESIRAQSNQAPCADQALYTIIIVDTSGSMDGEPLIEAGQFISQFIRGLEEMQFEYNLQENVALISVGEEIQVVQHFTNDYSLIRRATDTLTASGSSRLHMGLILPSSLLSNGSSEIRGQGGIYQVGNHIACPRIIFISDGQLNMADDIPGQLPSPDDEMLQAHQNICLDLTQQMTETTLAKIYCIPVGSANLTFLEMLSQCSGGKLIQPTDSKHMSRCLLHHVLVSKLNENGKEKPTRDEVAELLKQITATAEEDDINGVFELLDEGEPDVEGRNLRVTQTMMQAVQGRGRGGNRAAMQGLDTRMGSFGQASLPGGFQSFTDRGMGRIPISGGRRQPGGLPGGEGTESMHGLSQMFRMTGGRGRAGGYETDNLNGFSGGNDVLKRMMNIRRGRGMNRDGAGGGGEFMRMRERGGTAGGNGTDKQFSLDGLMGMVGRSEMNKTSNSNFDGDERAPFVMGSNGQGRSGQRNLESLQGCPFSPSFQEKKRKNNVSPRQANALSDRENGGQSSQEIDKDLGLIENLSEVVKGKADNNEHKESWVDACERGQQENSSLQNVQGIGVKYGQRENEELGLFNTPEESRKSAPRMKRTEEHWQVNRNENSKRQSQNNRQRLGFGICGTNAENPPASDSLGQVHYSRDRSLLDTKDGDNAVGTKSVSGNNEQSVMLGQEGGGTSEPILGLIKGKKSKTEIYQRGKLNTVPPCSFGVDEYGNASDFDLMDDNDSDEGNELMEKLGAWLGIDNEENDGDTRSFPEMFGSMTGQNLMEGGIDNQIPDLGGVPPDIEAFFQNLRTDSRVQSEDGDVIMRDSDSGIGLQGEAGERNLQIFGRENREQQPASFPRGFGLPAGGAPNRLQQFQQLWQNSQGGYQDIAHVAGNMDRQGEREDNENDYREFFGGV